MHRRNFLQTAAAGAGVAPLVLHWVPNVSADEAAVADATDWIVHSEVPKNAEPALASLVDSWITPVERFFVRSHGPTPTIDAKSHRVTVGGLVENELSFTVDELLAKFPAAETTCTITCAGNRRYEHSKKKPVGGVQWREGAIGNATWSGVRLIDVLKAAGVKPEARHVWFDGVDEHESGGHEIVFGASIPIEKALDETEAGHVCVLAAKMNGEPLTAEHGAPIRGIVPGYIGARSVKWLGKITLADKPSPNHYVAEAYKLVARDEPLAWAEAGILYKMPLNAAICSPLEGANVGEGPVTVAGYALPPGDPGVTIAEVQVSGDGGRTWQKASLSEQRKEFSWTLWTAKVDVSDEDPTLIVRAVDSAGGRQPFVSPWNVKGYMYNAWHRLDVES